MTTAIYARVSTEDQSVGPQLDRLRAATSDIVSPFVDDAVSGRLEHRPAFDLLREKIRTGEVDVVYVTKLDRLGRSAKAILDFFREAEDRGCRVVVLDQAIDTSTPVGRLVRTVLAAMAELEADLIRERTQDAMRAIKEGRRGTRSGKPPGRPRRLTPEKAAEIRALRYPDRGEGLPWKAIARRVGLPWSTCAKVRPQPPGANPPLAQPERGV